MSPGEVPIRSATLVAVLAALPLAWPETLPAASDVYDGGSAEDRRIVVTATRLATGLDEVLAPMLVIDRETIERSVALDATELLRFHAGLDLARNGGPGQTTAVFIRGAESNHSLVLLDGVRLNPGTIGLAQLQNIAPSMIERIEVVKGPRSALYGTDAIGGVINVVTRRGTRADAWSAEVGYGDYATRQASLAGGVSGGRASLDFGLSWLDSDGFPTRSVDTTDRGFDNLNAGATLRTSLGRSELALRHWRATGNTEYSDFFLTPVDQDFRSSTTTLSVEAPLGSRLEARVAATQLDDRIEQNDSADFLATRRTTLDAQLDWAEARGQQWSTGLVLARERASSESYGETLDTTTDSLSAFVQDRLAGGRHQGLLALGFTQHETAGSAVTWNAEYGFAAGAGTRLYALAGTGFRAPDATDRYGFGGNPDLRPERSLNLEAGLRHRIGEHQSVALAAFRNDIDDLIEFVTLSYDPFLGENRNVDEARITGVEASYEFASPRWRARVEAIHQEPENRRTGATLLRRARDSLTVSAVRVLGPLELGVDLLAAGERLDFGYPEPVVLDAYLLANLTARWQVTDSLALVGRVENLLDEQYELAHTYNTPDRGLYVALHYAPATPAGRP